MPLIQLENVSKSFGPQHVLRDITIDVRKGETLVLIGESGCGKSVTMKLMMDLLQPSSGRVMWDDRPLRDRTEKQITEERLRFGYLFQQAALFDSLTVYENVAFGLRQNRRMSNREICDIVHRRLSDVGLQPGTVTAKKPAELSGGMRKRVGLARALALSPEVMLYDEPTTGLDPIMSDVINELILSTSEREQMTSVVVTHDMTTVRKVADRVVMFYPLDRIDEHEPQIVFEGTASEAFDSGDPRVHQFVHGEAGERLMELAAHHSLTHHTFTHHSHITTVSERQLQFRVGLFVLTALAVGTVIILQFGEMQSYFETRYAIAIHFDEAPGVQKGVPVKQNGLDIGAIREVRADEDGGVLVIVEIKGDVVIRKDSQPQLKRTLFGDASIVFPMGLDPHPLPPNSKVTGLPPQDPLQIIERLDTKVQQTLTAFEETSREWQQVAANVNGLIDTKQGNLDDVVERAALALEEFTRTMQTAHVALDNANSLLNDPQMQRSLRATMNALPQMVEETRGTIAAARYSIEKIGTTADTMNVTLANMNRMTEPLAKATPQIVTKLDSSLGQLDMLLTELTTVAKLINQGDGTISKLASDPELYDNLNRSAASMPIVLANLNRIAADLRVFSDKIARHPELLGARGVLKGSDGLKDVPQQGQPIQQTGFAQPQTPSR